jgi:hypothetical protein
MGADIAILKGILERYGLSPVRVRPLEELCMEGMTLRWTFTGDGYLPAMRKDGAWEGCDENLSAK